MGHPALRRKLLTTAASVGLLLGLWSQAGQGGVAPIVDTGSAEVSGSDQRSGIVNPAWPAARNDPADTLPAPGLAATATAAAVPDQASGAAGEAQEDPSSARVASTGSHTVSVTSPDGSGLVVTNWGTATADSGTNAGAGSTDGTGTNLETGPANAQGNSSTTEINP